MNYLICGILLILYFYITWYQLTYEDSGNDSDGQNSNEKGKVEKDANSQDETQVIATPTGTPNGSLKASTDRRVIIPSVDPDLPRDIEMVKADGGKIVGGDSKVDEGVEEEGEDGEKDSRNVLLLKLAFAVVGLALASDVVTGAIDELNQSGLIPTDFMVFAIIGIVGNVPEHYSSLYMSWKHGDLSLSYGTAFGSSSQLIGLILPFLSIISVGVMPIVYDPKYLIMLQVSWIVPLVVVRFNLHSVPMGIFMCIVYAACAVLSYIDID